MYDDADVDQFLSSIEREGRGGGDSGKLSLFSFLVSFCSVSRCSGSALALANKMSEPGGGVSLY
jgi:hypothetical protein